MFTNRATGFTTCFGLERPDEKTMSIAAVGLVLAGVINLLLGLAVYSRAAKKPANIYFLIVCLCVATWNITMAWYWTTPNLGRAELAADVYYGATLGIGLSLVAFVYAWTGRRLRKLMAGSLLCTALSYILIAVFLPDPIVTEVYFSESGKSSDTRLAGLLVHNIVFLGLFTWVLAVLLGSLGRARRMKRMQSQYIITGLIAAGLLGIAFNLVLPLNGIDSFFWVGPQASALFVASVSYAIARHKLFDLRRTAARAMAYIITLGSLVGLYMAALYLLSGVLFEEQTVSFSQRLLLISLALGAAALFQPFKNFFDKATNRLFYRDAYEPQVFLDQFNQTLVTSIELGILLRHTCGVIVDHLACRYAVVALNDPHGQKPRVIGSEELDLNNSDTEYLIKELSDRRSNLTVADYLSEQDTHLRKVLGENDIAVAARLLSGYGSEPDRSIAFLILSSKKSGNSYDKQDLKIIEIIADELVIAIQNALRFEEIGQFNVTLQSRINQATEKLKHTNEKLKELDETKDEFLSMASHQLRTPLTSVKGYLSMVLDGDAGPLNEQQTKLLEQAFSSSQRMVYLIADLLNVSRLKTGKFVIEEKSTNLAELVASELDQLKQAAKAKKLTLTYHKPPDFPELMLDETKVRQVIMNFVDNAIYYTPSGGRVDIELKHDRSHVYFLVRDNGLGVPKDEQPHLFTKFYRAANARQARPDGTGLGLFMAKKVITAQGGQILFESYEGKGSVFGFKFKVKEHIVASSK